MTSSTIQFPAARRLTAAMYCMVLLAIGTFAHLENSETPMILAVAVVATAIILGRFRRMVGGEGVEGGGRPLAAPKWVINLAVLVAAFFFLYEVQSRADEGGHFFVTALGHFIEVLLLCKLFDRRSDRDLMQIIVLSLLMVVAGTMYSQSLSYAVLLFTYFAVLIYVILLGYLQHETQTATVGRALLVLPAHEQGRRFFRDARRSALMVVLVLVPIALLVFLGLPRNRVSGATLGSGGPGVTFQTGFSSTVQFRDYGRLAQSDEIVMEVRLVQNGQNMGSSYFEPYFRGQTQDIYEKVKRRWISAHAPCDTNWGVETKLVDGAAGILPEEVWQGTGVVWQEYRMYVAEGQLLFSLAPASVVQSGQLGEVYWDAEDFTLSVRDRPRPLKYSVGSVFPYQPLNSAMPNEAPPAPPLEETEDGRLIRFGDPDTVPEGIGDFAREKIAPDLLRPVTGAVPVMTAERTRELVMRFENYLRTHYAYSLDLAPVDVSLDPTLDFLRNRAERGGHCELFASAMVMLCRSQGINARMVQGFHGAEYNSISERYTVRQLHAHTWAEVYIPGSGWTLSDPTPSSAVDDDPNSVMRRWAREVMQIIENTWQGVVVSFDNETRRAVVQWFVSNVREPVTRFFSDIWASLVYEIQTPDLWGRLTLFGPMLGLFIVGLWLGKQWQLERRLAGGGRVRRPAKLTGDAVFMDELIRLVSRAQMGEGKGNGEELRQPYETPREFVEQYAAVLGEGLKDARWLIEVFYRMRFGREPVTAAVKVEVAEALGRVRQAVRIGSPK